MATEEIIQGNKLIAEFMGFKYVKDGDTFYDSENMFFSEELKYHSSWDWLMPVVEKIENMQDKNGWYFKIDIINRNEVECTAGNTPICYINGYDNKRKIIAVWLAVIEFIKWYNQNKQQ